MHLMNRMMNDFSAAFQQPQPQVLEAELERKAYAYYRSTFPPGAMPPTFEQWREQRKARGNAEGQNHD